MEQKIAVTVLTPFDIIDALFEMEKIGYSKFYDKTESQYSKISDKDKQKNFFIVNRRLAIGFPLQAFKLSQMGINPIAAMDSWYLITKKVGKKSGLPKWIYTKTEKEKKLKSIKISNDVKSYYMQLNNITEKEFNVALDFEPDKMVNYLKQLEKYLKSIPK